MWSGWRRSRRIAVLHRQLLNPLTPRYEVVTGSRCTSAVVIKCWTSYHSTLVSSTQANQQTMLHSCTCTSYSYLLQSFLLKCTCIVTFVWWFLRFLSLCVLPQLIYIFCGPRQIVEYKTRLSINCVLSPKSSNSRARRCFPSIAKAARSRSLLIPSINETTDDLSDEGWDEGMKSSQLTLEVVQKPLPKTFQKRHLQLAPLSLSDICKYLALQEGLFFLSKHSIKILSVFGVLEGNRLEGECC